MAREDGQFKPGNKAGGRPKKPEWLKGKGEEMLKVCYAIAKNEEENTANRLAAAKVIIEQDLGKPKQQLDMTAEVDAEIRKPVSLSDRKAALQEAVKLLEKG